MSLAEKDDQRPSNRQDGEVFDADVAMYAESACQPDRTPRPYFRDGGCVSQDANEVIEPLILDDGKTSNGEAPTYGNRQQDTLDLPSWQQSGQLNLVNDHESGTDADDERQTLIKELPPPEIRPRKGLKTGELNQDVLLTPAQLDAEEGRLLRDDYWIKTNDESFQSDKTSLEELRSDLERVQRRRLGEFLRRLSEVSLMLVMTVIILCGKGVLLEAWRFRHELTTHGLILIGLIAAYPVKLSVVDTRVTHKQLWQRFRVPASFDPATVLYPPLLPLLVALSVSPLNAAVIPPNVVLGLSALPQRLFPRSSRLRRLNELHWLISILPLIIGTHVGWERRHKSSDSSRISQETLVSLYPLHHTLLSSLSYITQTSLLISEAHLLAAALINLLLLAESPQTSILKACLWVGGLTLFVACGPTIRWYLTLVRVPKWRFKRRTSTERGHPGLGNAIISLIAFQRSTSPHHAYDHDSGSDADGYTASGVTQATADDADDMRELSIADLKRCRSGRLSRGGANAIGEGRPRRNTVPDDGHSYAGKEKSRRQSKRRTSPPWYLRLTSQEAKIRKQIYTGYFYAATVAIIIGPVQYYVGKKALSDRMPILWAVEYMLGQLPFLRPMLDMCGLGSSMRWWTTRGPPAHRVRLTWPLDLNSARNTIGEANVRLLIVAYWALVLLIGLLSVFSLTAFVEVDTRRKVFHGVMVAMLLPSVFVDPCCCALALTIILTVFLLLEVIRAGQVPPMGNAIGKFVAPYVDGRDLRGPVVISHIFLLIGCAIPLWFSLATIPRQADTLWKDWELVDNQREVAMVAGVICVGMGDAAASLIGRRYGKRKWPWVGGKSLEGSAAFALAVTAGIVAVKLWQVVGGWHDTVDMGMEAHVGRHGIRSLLLAWVLTTLKASFCACAASFMEAVLTGANDNVVVPIALWLLVRGCRI